jgi:putative intracellular protease/amidase
MTQDVHLFVLDTLADWEPGFAVAHINRPAPGMPSPYRVRTVGASRAPVKTLGGITIVPDIVLDELRPEASAMLILPGAEIWSDARMDGALAKARAFVDAGVPVAAICGATFGLARVGLLDERRHTSNDPRFLASSGYRGGALYENEPVVDDGNVITASAMAPLEFAHAILRRLGVFSERALEAWYGLYKTRDPACYFAFVEAVGHGPRAAS